MPSGEVAEWAPVEPIPSPIAGADPAARPQPHRPGVASTTGLKASSLTAFLARKSQSVIVIAALLSLAAFVCFATFVLWRPLPSAPTPKVAAVRYSVLEGDTLESVADYFQVSADTLPAGFATGQPMTLMPGNYAILFSGQAVRLDQQDGDASLEVASRFERYRVTVDLRAEGWSISAHATPEKGNTVTVLARPGVDGTLEALAVDVWQDGEWATWYHQGTSSRVWVYSAFHDQLVPASGEYSTLDSQPVLLLGNRSEEDSGFRLHWDEQDLYLFGRGAGEVYGPWLPEKDRQPLAQRFPAPATAPGAEGTIPSALPSTVSGTVTTVNGLMIRPTPSTQAERVDVIDYGEKVKIACQLSGEALNGDPTWYRVANPDKQPGYVSAYYIRLDEEFRREDIAPCGSDD
jgi:hypothetical protein